MPTTATERQPQEGSFEKRRKLDEDDQASRSSGPTAPPTPQGVPDGRYYDPYAMPRYYEDYREPPSMPYARGPPAPSPKHGHGHYAYPPAPPKDYYHGHYDYPPHSAWGYKGGPPPGQYSPRYAPPYEYDRQYAPPPPVPAGPPRKDTGQDSYQSPTSVVNALDTRSPEGSRNLNNFEERVGQQQHPPVMYPPTQYYPPVHSPGHAVPAVHPHAPSRQWWSCDYCSYKFSTWEECSAHEGMCQRSSGRAGKKRTVDALDDSCRFMHPSEEYANNTDRPLFSLALPTDGQSLSDRQCYVRTHFVELFVATEADVSARHSRGAQKLHLNQVGLRCAYCAKLKPRDRAERAVCYPSSISRIYQTVADMQRFHFETCSAIPPKVLRVYKSLKTTRPRGMGSPQSYWEKSAKELGLMDSDCGIALRDGGILVHRKVEDAPLGMAGAAPIPSLMPPEEAEHPSERSGPWADSNSAANGTPQETQEGQDKGSAPCEADASILLMLKNPDAASPKSTDGTPEGAAEDTSEDVSVKEETKLVEV